MKEYSGDSKIKTRGLFAHPIEWMPQFKIVINCNDIPDFSKTDGGVARRVRIIEFKYKFLDDTTDIKYDSHNPYNKQIDRSLNDKFVSDVRYKQAFAKILCDNWKTNVKHLTSMGTPQEVIEASKSFVDQCNDVLGFMTENYDITGIPDDKVAARDLFMEYKGGGGKLDEKEFRYRLNDMGISKKIIGKTKKSYRIGIKLRELEDNDKE